MIKGSGRDTKAGQAGNNLDGNNNGLFVLKSVDRTNEADIYRQKTYSHTEESESTMRN